MNQTDILESQSLWYKYKTKVWVEETPQTSTVHNIMQTLRSIHNVNPLAYISVPITSGKIYYELKLKYPEKGNTELIKEVIDHNYHLGWKMINAIIKRNKCSVLYPADLTPAHQKWEQEHFQALWLSIIAEKCTELHLCKGWEFSNGGVEEFTHVMQLRLGVPQHPQLIFLNTKENEKKSRKRMRSIKTYDHAGKEISLQDGLVAVERSLSWLKENGFISEKLENCQQILMWTKEKIKEGFYQ